MSKSFDKLFEVLKIRFKDHMDPERCAYQYIAYYAKHHIPEKDLLFAIEYVEKEIIMDTLKA
jgi:hypothetical protein